MDKIETTLAEVDTRGLFQKYNVSRTDPDAQRRHPNCRYFVLDVDHDPFARVALQHYAEACRAKHPALACDLFAMLGPAPGAPLRLYWVRWTTSDRREVLALVAAPTPMATMAVLGDQRPVVADEISEVEDYDAHLAIARPAPRGSLDVDRKTFREWLGELTAPTLLAIETRSR